jgi:hypothetical protein
LIESSGRLVIVHQREVIRKHRERAPESKLTSTSTRIDTPARAVSMADFVEALKHVQATGAASFDFLKKFQAEAANG